MIIHRLLARRAAGDRGVTMIELMVVIAIFSMLGAAVLTTTIVSQRSAGSISVRVDQATQARTAIEAMSKTLRTALLPSQVGGTCALCGNAAFIQGTDTSVAFYADINSDVNTVTALSGPRKVTYSVDASGTLTETIQAPNSHALNDFNYQWCTPGPGCAVTSRVLARGVQTSQPIFGYYIDGNPNTPTTTPLSSSVLPQVDSVDITIRVLTSTGMGVPATTYVQRVALPNHDAILQQGT